MLCQKLKVLGEPRGLPHRRVANLLDVDTAYISKMESNDKPVSRAYLPTFASLFTVDEQDLQTLWLAERIYDLLKNETLGLKAIAEAEFQLKQSLG